MKSAPGLRQAARITTPFPASGWGGETRREPAASHRLSPAQLGLLAGATAMGRAAWLPLVRFSRESRWFHRLARAADYEIWLLTWLPGQHTGFHDHGNAAGSFAVAQGELRETLVSAATGMLRHRAAREGTVTRFARPAPARCRQRKRRSRRERPRVLTAALSDAPVRADQLGPCARADRPGRGRLVIRPARALTIDEILAAARTRLTRLSPVQAQRAAALDAVLVDIRPQAQRLAEGEIPGALVVERNVLEWRFDPASAAALPIASYDLQIIVFCSEGYTSSLAAAALQDLGIGQATDLAGGFLAWRAAGLPVTNARLLEQRQLHSA